MLTKEQFLVKWHAMCDAGKFDKSERNDNIAWHNYQRYGGAVFPDPSFFKEMRDEKAKAKTTNFGNQGTDDS